MRSLLLIAIAALFAAPAIAAPAPATPAAAGQTRACLFNRDIRAKNLSAEKGYYVQTIHGWWHNEGAACPTFAPDRALRTNAYEDRQCDGDLVQIFEPITRVTYGGCVLGRWARIDGVPDAPRR